MNSIRIWYLGNDRSLVSSLRECIAGGRSFVVDAFEDGDEILSRLEETHPEVILVDQSYTGARDEINPEQLRSLADDVLVAVFLYRDSDGTAAVDALRAGYDLCWDALGIDSNLFLAALRREIEKKRVHPGPGIEPPGRVGGRSAVLNETVASLVEGTVELLKLKEDMEKRNLELELVRDELEQFVHTVSHDLKEPLMAVRTFTSLLIEELQDLKDQPVEHLKIVRGSVERMGMQIDGLLAFSRAGKVIEESIVEDPAALISDILRDKGFDRRDEIEVSLKSQLPPLSAHPEQLKQIFGNLISNGIKYNRSAKKVVEIGVVLAPPEEIAKSFVDWEERTDHTILCFADNGIGLQTGDRSEPFELFRRLDEEGEFEGDGVGLAIVKRVVNSLGGVIDYTSVVGKGTVMYVSLPKAARTLLLSASKSKAQKRSAAQLRAALLEKN